MSAPTTTGVVGVPDGRPPGAVPWLARTEPAVLLAVVVAVPLVLVRTYAVVPLLVLWCLAVLAVLTLTGLGPRRLLLAQLPFVSFGASLVLVNAVTRDGAVVASLGPLAVTDTGLAMGAALAVRTLLVGTCAVAFLAVVDPGRLLTSLHLVARLPVRVTCAALAAHRMLDDLPAEWMTIRRAHAVRRPARADGSREPARDVRSLATATFALLATSIRRAERVAVALESRALGALPRGARTVWRRPGPEGEVGRPGRHDVVLVAVCATALVLALATGSGG
ncbi:energy-coupling factor transporter transmembrane protein EcfT [Cellulomonas sp. APG4]|uniref:energy-coupling factor transporter transmembrane component T family protein n=1 Tax=Cellulomonas sp. APG4 TaxID=1538656 RepID=UPI00137A45E0|nr:energy-coupling factor transporter transmembrane component T [Cellulomonas sp. APG4]NCT91164.1 energy-coupling factor transporter transmembrane protein EcfT [Cellulomonas sp. APG4]